MEDTPLVIGAATVDITPSWPMRPSAEQLERFERDGYLVVAGALPSARVARLLEVIGRLEARLRDSEALVHLTTGGPQTVYWGGLTVGRLRYWDPDERRSPWTGPGCVSTCRRAPPSTSTSAWSATRAGRSYAFPWHGDQVPVG